MIALRVAAVLLLLLSSWIYLPAPNRTFLALGVGAPELAAWLALSGLAVSLAALIVADDRSRRRLTLALSIGATVLAAGPLVQLPFVINRFDAAMTAALGADYLRDVPAGRHDRMRPSAVALRPFFGFDAAGNVRVSRGIPFAAPRGVRLTLDVYRPNASGRYPTIVQIYGGAWQRGAPGGDAGMATYLAARGYVVFAIDYRHAPAWPWPAQIEDVRTAIAWIRLHAGDYDADATRLALFGRSAGAHLAMLAGYEGRAPVAAVVSYYGPVDLTDGYRNPPAPDPLDVRAIEEAFLAGTPGEWPDRYRAASPITYVSASAPPSLLIYGRRDHIVLSRYGADLAARLRAAGAISVFLEIPWAEHAFDAIPNGTSGQLSLYYTERFLAWALTRPPRVRQP